METIQPVTFTYDEIMLCVASEQIRDREWLLLELACQCWLQRLPSKFMHPRCYDL
jgi:hypothetical protein